MPTLDAPDRNGLTPLHWAIQRSGDVVVSLLVEAGANVNATDNEGRNCLHYALVSSVEGDKQPSYYEDLVRYLLERGANPNVPDAAGATSVHVASEFGLDSMVPFFLFSFRCLISSCLFSSNLAAHLSTPSTTKARILCSMPSAKIRLISWLS